MSVFEQEIAEQVSSLAGLTLEQVLPCIETPKNAQHGDYAFPIPKLNKFKKLQGNPSQIAIEWKDKIKLNDFITSVSVTGPYLNFFINKQILLEKVLKRVFQEGERYGTYNEGEGKTILVEYSSPNIAKPFHAGHLRSTIIGNFMRNIFKAAGYTVVGINYLGDWGKQYGLLAVGFSMHGNEEQLKVNPIRHLYEVYVKINADADQDTAIHDKARAYFKRMEQGDEEALALWKRFRDLSIGEYQNIYRRLNVEFDEYSGESLMSEGMEKAFQILADKKLLDEDKGAKIVNLENFKLSKVLVKKSDGTTLYLTRDIAAAALRHDTYHFERMYYVVAAQQDLHFQQLFKILDLMGYEWAKNCTHINFGMVKGMKTRKGTAVFLEDILAEAKAAMLAVMQSNAEKFSDISDPEAVADIVGLSAVVVQDFSANRIKDYDFSWDRVTSFEGDTGPYLQYQHARLCSMDRKTGVKFNQNADLSLLTEPVAREIAVQIGRYPDTVQKAVQQLEPCVLISYLFDLAHAISAGHSVLWVKDREQNLAEARMALFWAAKITLGNALRLIGLQPLERM